MKPKTNNQPEHCVMDKRQPFINEDTDVAVNINVHLATWTKEALFMARYH